MELLKLLSGSQIVAQIMSFLILFFVLRALVWKKFLGVLDSRREAVSAELKNIEKMKADVSKIAADYGAKIDSIEATARLKIQEAVAEGRKMADEIKDNARAEAEKMVENARATIKEEMLDAREALKEDIIGLTIDIAEKVVQEKLTEGEDRKMVEDFLKGMNK